MLKTFIKNILSPFGLTFMSTRGYASLSSDIRFLQKENTDLYTQKKDLQRQVDTLLTLRSRDRVTGESIHNTYKVQLTEVEEHLSHRVAREHDAFLSILEQFTKLQETIRLASASEKVAVPASEQIKLKDPSFDSKHFTNLGEIAEAKGDLNEAIAQYSQAVSLIHRYEPARNRMREISATFLKQAEQFREQDMLPETKRALVRAIELNPYDAKAREMLSGILHYTREYDMTKDCFVFHDPERGKAIYKDAFLRAAEYVAGAGLLGEFLEFGVLGGFTARLQCEIMRDLLMWRQIHLFDSFEGLPPYKSPIDQSGYDTVVRNVWENPMCMPEDYIRDQLGSPVDVYIFNRLSEIISPDRIFIYRGFFSETLRTLPKIKAALVHIDCDLYQSTVEVLDSLYENDVLQDGCVVMFDDFNCFRANPAFGERRAFQEFFDKQDRFISSPFFTYGWNGAAYFLHDKTVKPDLA